MVQPPDANSNADDSELLRRYMAGHDEAFAALVRRYQHELLNFLTRFTGDRSLAEDIFQEAFLQLHVSASGFDFTRRLKPWLFTIAANKARDAMRSRSRRHAAPLDAAVPSGGDERTSFADLLSGHVPAPDESLVNLETRRAVQTIVTRMPEALRLVLVLSYFHDFAYKEIADILGVPLGTVKSRLHAAVKEFARRWRAVAERFGDERADQHRG